MVEEAVLARPAAVRRRRLLVLVSKHVGVAPGQRFRLEQWAPRLARDHGIDLDFVPFESPALSQLLYQPGHYATKAALVVRDFIRRAGVVARARRYDAVVVFREAALLGPAVYERLIAALGVPIIFDFDDAIWLTGTHGGDSNNGLFSRLHFAGKTSTLCKLAAAVTPGNAYLADYAQSRNPATYVLPTSIELDDYPVQDEARDDGRLIVCWTGSNSTLEHFEHSRPMLERLAAQLPLTVRVICNVPPKQGIHGAVTDYVPWSHAHEARDVADCHVGIMPLPDTPFTRGKCGLKALQYMATGRPAVVSAVGMNIDLIEDGVNGYLCSDDQQFLDALTDLAKHPDRRQAMGRAARATVEATYSAQAVSARFAQIVRSVTDAAPPPPLRPGDPTPPKRARAR